MGKDSTSNILYAIGVIGSLGLVILFSLTLAILLFFPSISVTILDWVNILALIFVGIAMIAIYRDTGNKLPLIAMILLLVLQILVTLLLLDILFPLLLTVLDPSTAFLYLSWFFWIVYLVIYLIIGFSIWMTRNEIGIIATLTGVIFMIWSVLNLGLQFLGYGVPPSIWTQLWLAGVVIVWLFAFIYFIMAIRS